MLEDSLAHWTQSKQPHGKLYGITIFRCFLSFFAFFFSSLIFRKILTQNEEFIFSNHLKSAVLLITQL
jgi:hypothetical protein